MTYSQKGYIIYLIGLAVLTAACTQQEQTQPALKNIEDAVFASGYIEQEYNYTVSAKVDGILLSCPVKEGDSVTKGEIIATIENDVQNNQLQDALAVYADASQNASANSLQLQQIQTQIDQAKQQLAFDKENYVRYKDLREKNSVSQLEFEKIALQYQASQNNLESLEQNFAEVQKSLKLTEERSLVQVQTQRSMLKDYQLTTGVSGQVINVFKKQGELARRGEPIAKIGSGQYLIKLFVSEDDITKVALGQWVATSINTYPDEAFRARVTRIYPGFDEAEQSYIVEAAFEQMPEKMFSGTQLQANIEVGGRQNVLMIPTSFLSRGSYVMLENGREKQIITGSTNKDWTEVVSGLSPEDIILKP
ncbi:MAG: HlyD family efflux transporter periplasmic adaptor subunit [Bacteroidota bacterium]